MDNPGVCLIETIHTLKIGDSVEPLTYSKYKGKAFLNLFLLEGPISNLKETIRIRLYDEIEFLEEGLEFKKREP